MTKHRLSNWVDRGEPAARQVQRVLVRFLELDPEADAQRLDQISQQVIAFVAADGSEVGLADYLAVLQQELGREVAPGPMRRFVAIALWHIAKVGLMRDA